MSKKKSGSGDKIWGGNRVKLSPFYLGALRLKYCLDDIRCVNGKILEIGCGAGGIAKAIKSYRPDLQVFGCDISQKAIEKARLNPSGVDFRIGDAYKLPFEDDFFDAVVSFDVLEHLENPGASLDEIFRVLKKGAKFHAAVPLEANPLTVHGLFLKVGIKPKELYAAHIKQFNSQDIVNLFKKARFSDIKIRYSGYLIEQLLDFGYFFLLSLFRRKTSCTVEGYIESVDMKLIKKIFFFIMASLSLAIYLESVLLKSLPGHIGHFSAKK